MSEAAVRNRCGASFQYVTLVGDQTIAQAVLLIETTTMPHDQISTWGWHIAFDIDNLAAVVVLWVRRATDESLAEKHSEIRSSLDCDSGTMRTLLVQH